MGSSGEAGARGARAQGAVHLLLGADRDGGAPVIEDAVITGHDRDEIGLLIFPSLAGLRGLCPEAGADATLADTIGRPAVRKTLIEGLARHNAMAQGSSMRIARCLILAD